MGRCMVLQFIIRRFFALLLPTLLRQPEKTAARTFLLNYVGFTQKNSPVRARGCMGCINLPDGR